MTAKFGNPGSPADEAATVVPGDTTAIAFPVRAIYVGTAGNLAVTMAGGSNAVVTFLNVPSGAILPIMAKFIMATNTTATNIVALG